MSNKSDLLQGTLDLLILKTLAEGAMHGWGISLQIQQVSQDALPIFNEEANSKERKEIIIY